MKRKHMRLATIVCISVMGILSAFILLSMNYMNRHDRFNSLFQYYGDEYAIDWRLIKAIAMCESSLNQFAVSYSGAKGLMQLMDNTARLHGVISIFDVEDNIHGGVKEVERLRKLFYGERTEVEQTKFVLASYNGGLGYVEEAMRLATKSGESSLEWDSVARQLGNVRYRGKKPDVKQITGYVYKVTKQYEKLKGGD